MPHELTASNQQLAAIHALRPKTGMQEDAYRDFLQQQYGVRSAKELSRRNAGRVIERFKELAGQGAPLANGAVAGLDSPLGGKLRALWIAAYNLGLVRDRTDRAMLAFVERQTGVSHTRFFSDPRQGTQAVEGLKAWLARDAGVKWPAENDSDALGSRRAVVAAQWDRLVALGGTLDVHFPDFAERVTGRSPYAGVYEPHEYDRLQAAIGRNLRAAVERRDAEHAA